MDENEVQALENEQEVISTESAAESDVATDETVNLSKSEYTKLKRQALAYQSTKGKEETKSKADVSTNTDFDTKLKRLELKTEGYTNDEIETIFEFGVDKIDNPVVQNALKSMKDARIKKEADVSIPSKSAVYKTYTNQELANMSVEELRKILPHADN